MHGLKRRHAALALEVAVLAPVMFLLVFGLFEFSRMLWIQQAVTNAAREGGRKAALATTNHESDVDAVVRSYLQGTITNCSDSNKVRVTVSPSNISSMGSQEKTTTTVEVSYSDVSFYPPWFLGNAQLRGRATVERE